jgi:hypothetical protein
LRTLHPAAASALLAACFLLPAKAALAWGDEGHRVIALIADHYLEPAVKQKVAAILATDGEAASRDVAGASVWATAPANLAGHEDWHVVKLALAHPNIDAACGGHPALPAGTPASKGPATACSLDKIEQFSKELSNKATAPAERLVALKYLLSLVADLHQPIYVSDAGNQGGEGTKVVGGGADPGTLKHYWDSDFIDNLGDDPKAIADDLADGVRQSKAFEHMSAGTPADWTKEAFALAKDTAYGKLPAKKPDGSYELSPDYVTGAIEAIRVQMARAGVRLAAVINRALAGS